MNKIEEKLKEKIMGCLLAGAIGNAFGSPFESMDYYEIEKKFGRVEKFIDPNCLITEDDCHHTMVLTEAYLNRKERLNSFDLAKSWLELLNKERSFYSTGNTMDLLANGYSPQMTGILNLDTGAALMAIAPVGIYNACDPYNAYIDAIEISELNQGRMDVEVAALFAAAVAEAFKEDSSMESIVDLLIKIAPDKNFQLYGSLKEVNIKNKLEQILGIVSKYNDIYDAREEIYKHCLSGWNDIEPLEVFILSIGVFYGTKGDTGLSIIEGANMGRDADTIAGLMGSLNGTINGIKSVPNSLMNCVKNDIFKYYENISNSFVEILRNKFLKDRNILEVSDNYVYLIERKD